MINICLVRHGETDWNAAGILQGQQNIGLNAVGIQQATATGAYLSQKESPFDVIVTSPLRRAKETALIINERLQLPLHEMEEFAERAFGKGEGMTPEEKERHFPDLNFPGQEDEKVFYSRVLEGFEKLISLYENQRLLLVSHGLVIHLILNYLQQEKINYKQTTLLNGCISNISFRDSVWQVENINQVEHLK